MYTVSNET